MKKSIITFGIILIAIVFYLAFEGIQKQQSAREKLSDFYHSKYENFKTTLPEDGKSVKGDQPEMAALQNFFMSVDPELGFVPAERLIEAYDYAKELKGKHGNTSANEGLEWTETTSNMGGRSKAIMWDPNGTQYKKVWAGGVSGGLWYNEDITGSGNWQSVDDFWPSLSVHSMCYDPNNTQVFYIGTGEYETSRVIYRESSSVGIGIWKSEDGGTSWNIIPGTDDFKYVSDIQVRDENGTSVIYAGVVSGTYHGMEHQSEPNDGLYRSEDGGENWEQVLPNIEGFDVPYSPSDIEITSDNRIFIGTMKNLDGDGGATILYSDNGTAGSWSVFDDYEGIIENTGGQYNVPGRVMLSSAPSDPSVIYAIVGAGYIASGTGFNYAKGEYVLRSDNAGETWYEKNLPGGNRDWASLSWHAFIVKVNPVDPDDIYVGGLDVWKSANGGNSWSHISDWSLMYYGGGDEYVHGDLHNMVYRPGTIDEMILASDGGIFYTDNSTSNNVVFQEKNNGYSTLQFYTCDLFPVSGASTFVGGLQDNGTLIYSGSPLDINDMITGGDGAYCFFDENDPDVLITSVYYNRYYSFENWDWYDYVDTESGVFINPADIDSENDILYANGVDFAGSNGNKILRIVGTPSLSNYSHINVNTGINVYFSAIKVSPYSPASTSTLFLGSQTGQLFKVTNAQASPSTQEIGAVDFPAAYISSIAVGGSEDTLCVTFSNYGVSKVWQTYDGGASWTDISYNLPDMPVRWAIYHPDNSRQIMLATELGIWTTNNGHIPDFEWGIDDGFPFVRVDMLQLREEDNMVLAASHGRGMIYASWPYLPPTSIEENNINRITIYPNPSIGEINIIVGSEGVLTVYNVNGEHMGSFELSNTLSNKVDLSFLNSGVYILKIDVKGEVCTERLVIK